jgi:hypothetical protein
MTTTFSILDNLSVASPCNAEWDQMSGDARARHCQLCDKNVYNLSGMTRAEAEALLVEKEGRLCVRYFRRQDGTVLTRDCPVGKARLARRMQIAAWATAGAAVAAVGTALASAGLLDRQSCRSLTRFFQPAATTERAVMGEMPMPVEMGKVAVPAGRD